MFLIGYSEIQTNHEYVIILLNYLNYELVNFLTKYI